MSTDSRHSSATAAIRPPAAVVTALSNATGTVVAIAYSGGPDSTLALLWTRREFPYARLVALHYHHGIRKTDADDDEKHARQFARKIGVAFASGKRAPGLATDEASLRNDRDAWIRATMHEHRTTILVQGHHADDVLETILMRLSRGAGTEGLAAPRPVSRRHGITLVRPLLGLRKKEIVARLDSEGIDYRHDHTNDDPDIALRNRIRHRIIPVLETELGIRIHTGAQRSRMLAEEDADALDAFARNEVEKADSSAELTDALHRAPRAMRRRMLHLAVQKERSAHTLDADTVDTVLDALEARTPVLRQLTADMTLRYDGRVLEFQRHHEVRPPRAGALLPLPGGIFWPDGARMLAESIVSGAKEIRAATNSATVSRQNAQVLRTMTRSPGMRYHPLGAPGSQTVGDAMTNRKIPPRLREQLPVVMDDAEIIWIPGLPPSEMRRLSESESPALRLTWTSPDPA